MRDVIIILWLPLLLGAIIWLDYSSRRDELQQQAIQYGYAHYVGKEHKWEWIKPEGVK